MVQGLLLRPWWRHEATGIARREGPCTGMLAPWTQSGETVCVEGGSRHGSRRPSGRLLQTNRRDGRIERCVSASTSWTGACEGPGSERAGPGLVVTHCLSWVWWSRGCRTLTSSRLEGPALSRPSPVGPRLLPDALNGPGKHSGQFWIWLGQRYSSWRRQRSRIVLSRT